MEILSREQLDSDFEEEGYRKQEMVSISRFLKPKEKKKIYSKEGELATEIYEYFNKKLSYPRIMKMITENGYQCVFEIFKETRDKGVGLFIWVNNKERTKFK